VATSWTLSIAARAPLHLVDVGALAPPGGCTTTSPWAPAAVAVVDHRTGPERRAPPTRRQPAAVGAAIVDAIVITTIPSVVIRFSSPPRVAPAWGRRADPAV